MTSLLVAAIALVLMLLCEAALLWFFRRKLRSVQLPTLADQQAYVSASLRLALLTGIPLFALCAACTSAFLFVTW